jgi:hypothetical protein
LNLNGQCHGPLILPCADLNLEGGDLVGALLEFIVIHAAQSGQAVSRGMSLALGREGAHPDPTNSTAGRISADSKGRERGNGHLCGDWGDRTKDNQLVQNASTGTNLTAQFAKFDGLRSHHNFLTTSDEQIKGTKLALKYANIK